jgi:hypothetical protein
MRFFSTIAAFGLVAIASAQSLTESTNSTSAAASSATARASQTAQQRCLAACAPADICCQAACVNVPCPSELQANRTTECAAQCVQGNGTEEETSSYASCQSSCISSLFFSTGTAAAATGTAGSAGSSATATASGSGIGMLYPSW